MPQDTPAAPKTMQEEWRAYRDKVYPKSMPAMQNQELHQTFFAGAAIAIQKLNELSALPEDDATSAVLKLDEEIMAVLQARANQLLARNN
jgi:hypothetical protein